MGLIRQIRLIGLIGLIRQIGRIGRIGLGRVGRGKLKLRGALERHGAACGGMAVSPSSDSPASSRIFVPLQVTWIRFPPIWSEPRRTSGIIIRPSG